MTWLPTSPTSFVLPISSLHSPICPLHISVTALLSVPGVTKSFTNSWTLHLLWPLLGGLLTQHSMGDAYSFSRSQLKASEMLSMEIQLRLSFPKPSTFILHHISLLTSPITLATVCNSLSIYSLACFVHPKECKLCERKDLTYSVHG